MLQIQYGLSKKQMYTSSRSLVSLIVSPLHLPAPHFSQSLQDSHAFSRVAERAQWFKRCLGMEGLVNADCALLLLSYLQETTLKSTMLDSPFYEK